MLSKTLQLGAAGNAGGGPLYVDDVFSCFVYEGNNSSQTITNGIDLSGKGGLVWVKGRTSSYNHIAMDTERGATSSLKINNANEAETISTRISGFTSTGFSVGSNANVNASNNEYVSWTFRKAPGFFDIVTYTGNGSNPRAISHSLGSKPGMMWVKRIDSSAEWHVYHQSLGATKYLHLEENYDAATNSNRWGNTEPTSTQFTVDVQTNINGATYVAYLFAHDEQSFGTDEDEAIIKCGSYTGNGSDPNGPTINLGFEPQWLLIRRTDVDNNWMLVDNMRGTSDQNISQLKANLTSAEENNTSKGIIMRSNGFQIYGLVSADYNANSGNYIYMAIRRPHKPLEAGTDVFNTVTYTGNTASGRAITTNILTDTFLLAPRAGDGLIASHSGYRLHDRLRLSGGQLRPFSNVAEITDTNTPSFDVMDGFNLNSYNGTSYNYNEFTYVAHAFRRAPGFFDVVVYTGTGANRSLSHNLEAVPELIILKSRSAANDWFIYSAPTGNGNQIRLNSSGASEVTSRWQSTTPTSTQFYINGSGLTNASGSTYIGYLFASLDGISKVGSYTGTGNNLSVNCGFAAGARFVLIKRTDSTGDWWVFDTTRGIVSSGNDPALRLNLTNAEVTNTNYLEPNSNGFTVTSTAGAGLNANGGTYLYLAIA